VKVTLEVEILACLYVAERHGLDSLEKWVDSREMRGSAVTLQSKEDTVRLTIMMDMEKWNQEVSEGITEVWETSEEEAFHQGKAGWPVC
jgi:hypothetical protein